MRLILIRHGETVENQKRLMMGSRMHGKLSEKGIMQAKKVALRLKDEKIDHIYSSDLKRAIDTANEIAKFHPNARVKSTELLREIDWGSKTNKIRTVDNTTNLKNPAHDTEALVSLQKRTKKAIDNAYKKYPKGTVLFVAHGHTNRMILANVKNDNPEKIYEYGHPNNTSVSVFEIKKGKSHKIHLLNCTKHLE
jgi:broad specificity phosphatase PhoE